MKGLKQWRKKTIASNLGNSEKTFQKNVPSNVIPSDVIFRLGQFKISVIPYFFYIYLYIFRKKKSVSKLKKKNKKRKKNTPLKTRKDPFHCQWSLFSPGCRRAQRTTSVQCLSVSLSVRLSVRPLSACPCHVNSFHILARDLQELQLLL